MCSKIIHTRSILHVNVFLRANQGHFMDVLGVSRSTSSFDQNTDPIAAVTSDDVDSFLGVKKCPSTLRAMADSTGGRSNLCEQAMLGWVRRIQLVCFCIIPTEWCVFPCRRSNAFDLIY